MDFIIGFVAVYVLFQLYEYNREKTARHVTVGELRKQLGENKVDVLHGGDL